MVCVSAFVRTFIVKLIEKVLEPEGSRFDRFKRILKDAVVFVCAHHLAKLVVDNAIVRVIDNCLNALFGVVVGHIAAVVHRY